MFKTFRTLAFVAIGLLLSMPALAMEVQSDGLTLNSHVFIDSLFEFTEETKAPLDLILTETTVTAVILAQIRTTDSANDKRTQTVLTFDSVTEKLPGRKFEVGWKF